MDYVITHINQREVKNLNAIFQFKFKCASIKTKKLYLSIYYCPSFRLFVYLEVRYHKYRTFIVFVCVGIIEYVALSLSHRDECIVLISLLQTIFGLNILLLFISLF